MHAATPTGDARRPLVLLAGLAAVSSAAYAAVLWSSQSLHEGTGRHSLLVLLVLFAVAFGCYLIAIRIAVRAAPSRKLLAVIGGGALLFRGLLLFSDPIEEIDLYRYLWDGMAAAEGVNPYRYSPHQVLAASEDADIPENLSRLAALRDGSPTAHTILSRIHFGQFPTIYPPVSQAVFSVASWLTPGDASLRQRLIAMKAWFVAFDVATLLLVIWLLRFAGRPLGWSLAYAWCPLPIKEVANSGHLDALAVFLTTAAICLAVAAVSPSAPQARRSRRAVAGAVLLALAVGAKLYPVILAPWLFFLYGRRLGWKQAGAALIVFGGFVALVLSPMLPGGEWAPVPEAPRPYPEEAIPADGDLPPLPPEAHDVLEGTSTESGDPSQSLRAFLTEWEMNDFLFMLIVENLRPTADLPRDRLAWFSIVPEEWRGRLSGLVQSRFDVSERRGAFLLARAITSLAFVLLAGWWAWRASRSTDATVWLEAAFLTIAWFWLLLPTLNPWYWLWALPLVPFARNRAWVALSGLVFLYYLRFWLTFHFGTRTVLSTRYAGPVFFDYVVTWLEFGPWFLWLAVEWLAQRRFSREAMPDPLEPGERIITSANFLIDSESRLRSGGGGMMPGMPGMEGMEGMDHSRMKH